MSLSIGAANPVTDESRALIDEFIRTKGVTTAQPFLAPGSEASLSTRDLVTRTRREFRKANKPAKK